MAYLGDGCDFYYDETIYVWMYAETPCGAFVQLVFDFAYGVLFFCLVLAVNVATFVALRRTNQVPQS